jgi:hypothetical protein
MNGAGIGIGMTPQSNHKESAMLRGHLTRIRLGVVLAVVAGVVLGAVFGQPGSGVAASNAAKPVNKTPPTITGTAEVGLRLTATRGTWTGSPTRFSYIWSRCDTDGACVTIAGATGKSYRVRTSDVGHTLVVTVTAYNAAGGTPQASPPTATVPPSGCPVGTGAISIGALVPPAQLEIVGASVSPALTRSSKSMRLRVVIQACGNRPVQGAIVFATAIPFNQFAVAHGITASDGSVKLTEGRRAGFPAATHQRLVAVFIRATKPGDPELGGVSARRVVAFRFHS